MNLFLLLIHTAPLRCCLAVVAGIVSGASSAGLIALIITTLSDGATTTAPLLWIFTALCLLRLLTGIGSQILLVHLSQKAIFKMRMLMSRQILASPLRHLEAIGPHRLLATLTGDVHELSQITVIIPFFCVNFAILLGCLAYLYWLSPAVFAFTLGFMILGIASYLLPLKRSMFILKRAREQEDRLYNHFRAITEGTKELKLHPQRRQAFLDEDLHRDALIYRHHNIVGLTVLTTAASWGQIMFFIGLGLLIFSPRFLGPVTEEVLLGYALTIIYMMTPLDNILGKLPLLSKANVALRKIDSLGLSLNRSIYKTPIISPACPHHSWKRLKLVSVTHSYYQDREEHGFLLGPISLEFTPGELVFIIGGNGSGKSTLVKLITGLYTPETGKIYFDGQAIRDQNLEWYCQQFSVVFSDFYLFDRLLGLNHSDNQIQHYLTQLQLEHKVKVKDGIFSTTALSQGQRKRLALLTAYLEDRPIYVFDEWASDQDPIFKKLFYTQMLPELKKSGKTILVISHDDQHFNLADRMIKLEFGQVIYDLNPSAINNSDRQNI